MRKPVSPLLFRWILTPLLALAILNMPMTQPTAHAGLLGKVKNAGKWVGKAGKTVGKEVGKAGKTVGKGIGKAGKTVGEANVKDVLIPAAVIGAFLLTSENADLCNKNGQCTPLKRNGRFVP